MTFRSVFFLALFAPGTVFAAEEVSIYVRALKIEFPLTVGKIELPDSSEIQYRFEPQREQHEARRSDPVDVSRYDQLLTFSRRIPLGTSWALSTRSGVAWNSGGFNGKDRSDQGIGNREGRLILEEGDLEWSVRENLTLRLVTRLSRRFLTDDAFIDKVSGGVGATITPFSGMTIFAEVSSGSARQQNDPAEASSVVSAGFTYQIPKTPFTLNFSGWTEQDHHAGYSGVSSRCNGLMASIECPINERLWCSATVELDNLTDQESNLAYVDRMYFAQITYSATSDVSLSFQLNYMDNRDAGIRTTEGGVRVAVRKRLANNLHSEIAMGTALIGAVSPSIWISGTLLF